MLRLVKISLLLGFFALCGSALLFVHRSGHAAPAPAPHELFDAVNSQLAAFRADDFPGAYHRASSGVQQKFTLQQFEQMVRSNYTTMMHAQRVEFGSVQFDRGNALVQVFFFVEGGSVRSFLYTLVSEGAAWKIQGVEEFGRAQSSIPLAGSHA